MPRPNPTPVDAKNCVLWGYVRNASGVAQQNVSVLIMSPQTLPESGWIVDGSDAVGEGTIDRDIEVLTDVNGYFSVEVRRGRLIRLYCVRLKLDVTNYVPDQNNQDVFLWALQPRLVDSRQFCPDPMNAPTVVNTSVIVTVDYQQLPNALELYDQIKIYRAATPKGTYAEVTTVATRMALVPGQTLYEFTQTGVNPGLWYKCRFFNSAYNTDGALSQAWKADAPDYAQVCLVQELLDHYLFGVNLTDDRGKPYPRSLYEAYIRDAVGWIERELDISLRNVARVERQDYQYSDFRAYGYIQLDYAPVLAMDKIEFMLGSQQMFDVPSSWWALDQSTGVVRIVPTQGALSTLLLAQSGVWLGPSIMWANDQFPQFFRLSYRHGFDLGQIPAEIKNVVLMKAAIGPLNIAGDLLIGAGIANVSVSGGGVSQSIGTTSSPTNAGYGARIIQYHKEIDKVLPGLRRYWRGIRAQVV